jgi:phenylalanyl-tRNA synthetase beta chain
MKFTLSWLKRHLETDADLAAITERLTSLGLEVEAVIDRGAALSEFTVAYVIEASPHPNADTLQVCRVDTGRGEVQVVCGAANARTGMKGVFAGAGQVIPGSGLKLKQTKIRDVESNGMLLSERELGLGDDHDGIVELPDDAPLGEPFAPVLGLDDPLIDIAITPDRGDCLGVYGIARDLAASGLGVLKALDEADLAGGYDSPIKVHLDLDGDACPLFIGRHIKGVTNRPSPKWLRDRLTSIGLRPISALVDITNWMTFDLGRPAHVFDADRITGDLRLRLGKKGDKFRALDDKDYTIDETMTAICDDGGLISLAGVMGGETTSCTAETKNVFIEIAQFDAQRTAATGRSLGIESDARYRFERGVDADFMALGERIASRLILELCGGQASRPVIAGAAPKTARQIPFDPARVAALGGVEMSADGSFEILKRLGFSIGDGTVTTPSWRPDIEVESDVVEEVLRVHGFDRIAAVSLPRDHGVAGPVLTTAQRRLRWTRRSLAARGLVEAVTWSFIPEPHATLFGGGDAALRLANPISSEMTDMRPSLLPGLIAAVARNIDRGFEDIALFETGHVYSGLAAGDQAMVVGAVRRGRNGPRHWAETPRPVDSFDAKADALDAIAACGGPVDKAQFTADAPPWYHPGRSGAIRLGATVLAYFGELHPSVCKALDVAGPLVGCEIFLDAVPQPKARPGRAKPPLKLSPLQPVVRDFAFVVDEDIRAGDLLRAARGADKKLIDRVAVFDSFSGAALGANKKSIAITVTLQPLDRTLTEADIEAVSARLVAAVEKATGGSLRG